MLISTMPYLESNAPPSPVPLKILTTLHDEGGRYRMTTTVTDRYGKQISTSALLSPDVMEPQLFELVLEQQAYNLRQFVTKQAKDALWKNSPDYREIKDKLDEAETKLNNLRDVLADLDEGDSE